MVGHDYDFQAIGRLVGPLDPLADLFERDTIGDERFHGNTSTNSSSLFINFSRIPGAQFAFQNRPTYILPLYRPAGGRSFLEATSHICILDCICIECTSGSAFPHVFVFQKLQAIYPYFFTSILLATRPITKGSLFLSLEIFKRGRNMIAEDQRRCAEISHNFLGGDITCQYSVRKTSI
jgi:hypothetical protein